MNIALLLSGGVDSSVALSQLVRNGHSVTAFYLKIWLEDELSFLGDCPWEEDLSFARSVCQKYGVELRIVPFQKEYHDQVVAYTIAEVQAGRTPSPDVMCNSRVKFGAFIDYLGEQGESYDAIASGHYAFVTQNNGRAELHSSPDKVKDQTYFLAHLRQDQLSRLCFPIGHMKKHEVREIAEKEGLDTAVRKDSQGICFLGKISYPQFIEHYLGTRQGDIVEFETGTVLGQHNGFWFHTIGQRKGLGLSGGPWYVVKKDSAENRIFVSRNYFDDDKERNVFYMTTMNWIAGERPEQSSLEVKLRHGPDKNKADIEWLGDGRARVVLARRDQGIAPGQYAVFYDGTLCLGSGIIELE